MTAAAVADASPLIALQQIGQLELLRALFGQVTIPPAVAREVRPTVVAASWIVERALAQPIAPLAQRATLALLMGRLSARRRGAAGRRAWTPRS